MAYLALVISYAKLYVELSSFCPGHSSLSTYLLMLNGAVCLVNQPRRTPPHEELVVNGEYAYFRFRDIQTIAVPLLL